MESPNCKTESRILLLLHPILFFYTMEKGKKIQLYNPQGLRSIYVCHSSKRYGIAVGTAEDYAFHEYPNSIELWQKTSDGLKKVKRFNKKNIAFMEYEDKPFMWVLPRPYIKDNE